MKKTSMSTADQVAGQQAEMKYIKIPLSHRIAIKAVVFILTIVMLSVGVLSVLGIGLGMEYGFYTETPEQIRNESFSDLAESHSITISNFVLNGFEEDAVEYCQGYNISGITIQVQGSKDFIWKYGTITESDTQHGYASTLYWNKRTEEIWSHYYDDEDKPEQLTVTVYVPEKFTAYDEFYTTDLIISVGYSLRYWLFATGAVSLLVGIFGFVFLMCSAGHRKGLDEVQSGWGTRVPLDLLTVGYLLACFLIVQLAVETGYSADWMVNLLAYLIAGVIVVALSIGLSMSVAVRLKLGGWWKHTIICYTMSAAWKLLRKIGKMMGEVLRLFWKIPLVWKTGVVYLGLSVIELFFILVFYWDSDVIVVLWMIEKFILFPVVIYLALVLRKLQKGGRAIAQGDLNYQVDTKYMPPEFRQHGENLNQIGVGMTLAVEQRLKSERMKTELITNVSHDIKTPLTSIINYSDLIEKEPCDNPKITEYAEVLHRQSDRLKRLIEDLVEASKASTGNLDVHLAPCEVDVMIAQTAGEYEQRLTASQLDLITRNPEKPIRIMADGRRLWRVFDNLMNNICKYGQPGTRVYLTLEQIGTDAVISFKNTSREPLNLSAEELMERFVRGDSARNSEGNGLGLSIAKSLTELQHGSMEVSVDGDLFKVILRFPKIP